MLNPEQPDINRIRTLRTEAIPRGDHGVAGRPDPALHIDGDDSSIMLALDLRPDVALVHLITEASDLLEGRRVTISVSSGTGSPLEDSDDGNSIQPHTTRAGSGPWR